MREFDTMNNPTMLGPITIEDINKQYGDKFGTISIDSLTQSKTVNTEKKIKYKYAEDRIISELKAYIDTTYGQHYMTEEQNIECFDVWLALGDSMPTFRNTAIKYLWRYGKKNGSNKQDLLKVLHYVLMMLYIDHYKKGE